METAGDGTMARPLSLMICGCGTCLPQIGIYVAVTSNRLALNLVASNSMLTTSHAINLGNLAAGATYYFIVVSTDDAGNTATMVIFWLSPLFHLLSRRHEYEADAYAAELVKRHQPLISALRKLDEKNLSNLTPHRLYSSFYYSHPTLLEREAALTRLAESCPTL
jgi:Zn-dependent protease with chaperone function